MGFNRERFGHGCPWLSQILTPKGISAAAWLRYLRPCRMRELNFAAAPGAGGVVAVQVLVGTGVLLASPSLGV